MLIDDPRMRGALRGIVRRLSSDPALQEDLWQVGMVQLWLLETQRPGQTSSWYLQNCKFHLRNYLRAGRSIDSLKRDCGRVSLDQNPSVRSGDGRAVSAEECPVLEIVSARDILGCLNRRLGMREQQVLAYLAEGLGAREIARILGISHAAVVKRRRKVATAALRLGIEPPPNPPRHRRR